MPSTPDEIVEALREMAGLSADEMNEGNAPLGKVMSVPVWAREDTTEWEAADVIERFHGALRSIADGAPEPQKIASEALEVPQRGPIE